MRVKIINPKIVGLKNPKLVFSTTDKKNIKVFSNEKEYEIEVIQINAEQVNCEVIFDKDVKYIEIYYVDGNENKLLVRKRNHIVPKMLNKVAGSFRLFFHKFKRVMHYIMVKLKLSRIKKSIKILCKGVRFLWKEHRFLIPPSMLKKYFNDYKQRMRYTPDDLLHPMIQDQYLKWVKQHESFNTFRELEYQPTISILIPVYNIGEKYLSECIDSILAQTYQNFEVCLADDCSTKEETIRTLKKYEESDPRIKVHYRSENGHISRATNDALALASGEFVALMDNDDFLSKHALFENVLLLNEDKSIDFIYSDEDKIDLNGKRCDPHFKPDYSPDTLLSSNYICHFSVFRRDLMDAVGGFEVGMEGSQDHDLFLKICEKAKNIRHISKILYHWRMVEGSTSMTIDNKSYALQRGRNAVQNAIERRGYKGSVSVDESVNYYQVDYDLDVSKKASIIIPTRDYADITRVCLRSLFEKTKWKNFEVIVANNDSQKQETFDLFNEYKNKYSNFKVVDCNYEFNYSRINNDAIAASDGEVIILLNNDTEIISENWLEVLMAQALLPHVGTVGPKLLYPDETIQHAGVIMGLGGVASHAYIGAPRDEVGLYARVRVNYNYAAVTAACLAVERSKFNEVNGLEEGLQVAYNDVDFNLKLLEAGYYNVCIPRVELFHHESKSRGLDTTSEKYKRFMKESEYMYQKWDKYMKHDPYYNDNYSKNKGFYLDK